MTVLPRTTESPLAPPTWRTWLSWAAVAAATVLALALAWRLQCGLDLGYHLACGNSLLGAGGIVDTNRFLYTPDAYPGEPEAMNISPGSWRDAQGRYRFPNHSYASQAVMALAYRWGGFEGLCLLQVFLVAACMVLLLVAMRRLGVPVLPCAAGILLAAWTMCERFNLRPEMFAFVFLAAQFVLLAGRGAAGCSLGPWGAAGLVLLQGLFVQFHGYWIYGVAMTGLYFATATAGMVLSRWRHFPPDAARARRFWWLAAALAGQVAIVFANPWGWRLAAIPIVTLAGVTEPGRDASLLRGINPQATVTELFPTFAAELAHTRTTWALVLLLALAGLALLAALALRRWNWAALLLVFALAALPMRRNIAPAALVLTPLSLAALFTAAATIARRVRPPAGREPSAPGPGRFFVPALAGLLLAVCVAWTGGVATNRFYLADQRAWRFGAGCSAVEIPVGAYQAAVAAARDTRLFCSYNVSSNLLFFGTSGSARLELPILTNALAYPPMTMALNLAMCAGERPHEEFFARYNVGVAVLDLAPPFSNAPLAQALQANHWTLARVDGRTVVFVRPDLPAPRPNWQETDSFLADTAAADPLPAHSLYAAGTALNFLQNNGLAAEAFRRARDFDPDNPAILNALGICHFNLALAPYDRWQRDRQAADLAAARQGFQKARECFEQTLALDPRNAEARAFLIRMNAFPGL